MATRKSSNGCASERHSPEGEEGKEYGVIAMPQVILVRLVPMKPTSGADFSNYLANLSIRAFDLSFGNTADGTLVGQAQGAWVPNVGINATGPAFTPATQRILQHFSVYPVQVNPLPAPP